MLKNLKANYNKKLYYALNKVTLFRGGQCASVFYCFYCFADKKRETEQPICVCAMRDV